jgi:hypothetical protein
MRFMKLVGVITMISTSLALAASTAVDAVSGATVNNQCKFTLITPAATSVLVKWSETESGGTATICYGQTNPPTICRTVTAAERSAKTLTLSGLTAATTYNLLLDIREGTSLVHWYQASGQFATTGTAVIEAVRREENSASLTIGHHSIGRAVRIGDLFRVVDLHGRLLAEGVVSAEHQRITLPGRSGFTYIISVVRNGRGIFSSKEIIEGNR